MSEKLENKNKRGRLTWASSLCSPVAAGRPSQQAAQPAPSSVVFVLASATPRCFFSVPPRSPGLIPLSLPCCSLSLSHGRTPPSPPFATAAISGHPSLPRLAQKLRHNSLFLPTAPQLPGSPASPPRRRSPLRAPTIIADEFAVSSASPSPLQRPLQPR